MQVEASHAVQSEIEACVCVAVQSVHVGEAPATKVWKPAAHVPAEHVEASHAVQSEIEACVCVVEHAARRNVGGQDTTEAAVMGTVEADTNCNM